MPNLGKSQYLWRFGLAFRRSSDPQPGFLTRPAPERVISESTLVKGPNLNRSARTESSLRPRRGMPRYSATLDGHQKAGQTGQTGDGQPVVGTTENATQHIVATDAPRGPTNLSQARVYRGLLSHYQCLRRPDSFRNATGLTTPFPRPTDGQIAAAASCCATKAERPTGDWGQGNTRLISEGATPAPRAPGWHDGVPSADRDCIGNVRANAAHEKQCQDEHAVGETL